MREGKKSWNFSKMVSVLLVAFTQSDADAQASKIHSFCESGQESEDLSEPSEFLENKSKCDLCISSRE